MAPVGEAFDDFRGRLDLVQRHRTAGRTKLEETPQGQVPPGLIVDQPGIFPVSLVLSGTGRMLQLGDRIRRPHVLFATDADAYSPPASSMLASTDRPKGFVVQANGFLGMTSKTPMPRY